MILAEKTAIVFIMSTHDMPWISAVKMVHRMSRLIAFRRRKMAHACFRESPWAFSHDEEKALTADCVFGQDLMAIAVLFAVALLGSVTNSYSNSSYCHCKFYSLNYNEWLPEERLLRTWRAWFPRLSTKVKVNLQRNLNKHTNECRNASGSLRIWISRNWSPDLHSFINVLISSIQTSEVQRPITKIAHFCIAVNNLASFRLW